jgi:hypothetical protein
VAGKLEESEDGMKRYKQEPVDFSESDMTEQLELGLLWALCVSVFSGV